MKIEEIRAAMVEDEQEGLGEILEESNEKILYYDYESGVESTYRAEDHINLEWVESRIFIGDSIQNKGLTHSFVAKMLEQAFGNEFIKAVTTLNGVVAFSTEEELLKGIAFVAEDEVEEVLANNEITFDSFEDKLGMLWYRKQTVFICEKTCYDAAKRFVKELYGNSCKYELNDEYSNALIVTFIHELRHLMLETNLFLDEKEYPLFFNAEVYVEKFSLEKYDKLPAKYKRLPYKVA